MFLLSARLRLELVQGNSKAECWLGLGQGLAPLREPWFALRQSAGLPRTFGLTSQEHEHRYLATITQRLCSYYATIMQ